jgi:hypothetical protein
MFHPVGPQAPSVYWRRRLVLLASIGMLLVLLILTVKIATSDGSEPEPKANGPRTPVVRISPGESTSHATHPPSPRHTSSPRTTSSTAASSSAAPKACSANDLDVEAVASKPSYSVGEQPVLELQVTNTGEQPCVQDLADSQIELKVYNGESRVWGSHDCLIQPGTNLRTLEADTPVRIAITWSGLSSQPQCAGTRQRVGAGTYTLYALLSGETGKATQFSIIS